MHRRQINLRGHEFIALTSVVKQVAIINEFKNLITFNIYTTIALSNELSQVDIEYIEITRRPLPVL